MKLQDYERRIVAFFIDTAFSLILSTVILSLLAALTPLMRKDLFKIFPIAPSIVLFIYLLLFYTLNNGCSVGGMITNVKIVNSDGSKMNFRSSLVRSLLLALFILAVYNAFYMLFKRTQISLYDNATETRAVYRVEENN